MSRSRLATTSHPAPPSPSSGRAATLVARELVGMRWGLVGFGSNGPDPKRSTFNARAENLTKSDLWRVPLHKRRCLVPISGFFEWRKPDKVPFRFTLRDEPLYALAGLWDPPMTNRASGNNSTHPYAQKGLRALYGLAPRGLWRCGHGSGLPPRHVTHADHPPSLRSCTNPRVNPVLSVSMATALVASIRYRVKVSEAVRD